MLALRSLGEEVVPREGPHIIFRFAQSIRGRLEPPRDFSHTLLLVRRSLGEGGRRARPAQVVPRRGLEPPRDCSHAYLKRARIPIPPPGLHFIFVIYLIFVNFVIYPTSTLSSFPNTNWVSRKDAKECRLKLGG